MTSSLRQIHPPAFIRELGKCRKGAVNESGVGYV